MPYLRSILSTPGQRQPMIDKAFSLSVQPDGVLLDLEDAVPPAMKDTARGMVAEALHRPRQPGGASRFVRVNAAATGRLEDDIRAVVQPGLDGICLPKVERVEDVLTAAALLDEIEPRAGVGPGETRLLVSIETARGLLQAPALLAANPRVLAVLLGYEDFSWDVGLSVKRGPGGRDLLNYARSCVMIAAASVGLQAVDGVSMDFGNEAALETLRREAQHAREMGFTGKWCIHPTQIQTIHEVFTPPPEDVEFARRIVAAFDEAVAAGLGAAMLGGQFIEAPIVERAQRTLRLHERLKPPAGI